MKPSLWLVTLCTCAVISAACADEPLSTREKFYENDKNAAFSKFGKTQKTSCMLAFQDRYRQSFHIDGELAFNDRISETLYDQLFWNGSGDRRRGVAFTAPVSGDEQSGTLICYYAVTDTHLAFQDAFVLLLDGKEFADVKQ